MTSLPLNNKMTAQRFYLNNKILSLGIHSGCEGSDVAEKIHNPHLQVMCFFYAMIAPS